MERYLADELNRIRLAIAEGEVNLLGIAGVTSLLDVDWTNKFGEGVDFDTADGLKEIWDGQSATNKVTAGWVAPNAALAHNVNSTSANDTAAGTGAQVVRIWGLPDWDSEEVSEDITLNGATPVMSANTYVIVHRMKVIQTGSGGTNAGRIQLFETAGFQTVARIEAGNGQSLMAIYGVPSTQSAVVTSYYASIIRGALSSAAEIVLQVAEYPDTDENAFVTKHANGITTDGSNYIQHRFEPYAVFPGPCIIKLMAEVTANNTIISGGFDVILT